MFCGWIRVIPCANTASFASKLTTKSIRHTETSETYKLHHNSKNLLLVNYQLCITIIIVYDIPCTIKSHFAIISDRQVRYSYNACVSESVFVSPVAAGLARHDQKLGLLSNRPQLHCLCRAVPVPVASGECRNGRSQMCPVWPTREWIADTVMTERNKNKKHIHW